jgi:CubicO group peptidase (beta-lactamase class C family)
MPFLRYLGILPAGLPLSVNRFALPSSILLSRSRNPWQKDILAAGSLSPGNPCQPQCVPWGAEVTVRFTSLENKPYRSQLMRPRFQLILLAAVMMFPPPFAEAQGSASGSLSHSAASADLGVARLESDIPDLMKQADVPGLSIAVIERGRPSWSHNFGVKNATTKEPVTDRTIFEAASLSKPVFTYAVLKLVDQGKLGLDVPLTTYLPKPYIEGDDRLKKITARIVLSHRTGFRNWRGDGNALKIYFTPGERFSYSGEGFVYLQRVVEQIAGKPLNLVMTDLVFTPLGMVSSSYVWRADFDERTATGHDASATPQDLWKPKEAGAASTLNTTAHDYALFLAAILNGTGLRSATVREMETPQIAVDPECTNCTDRTPKELSKNLFWGLGWGIERAGETESLWHWGDNGSFKCFVVANLQRKSGLVMFTNSENGLAIAPAMVRELTGNDFLAFRWLKYDAYDSPAMRFSKAVGEKGAEASIQEFAGWFKDGTIGEGSINSVGYRLLWQKRFADAIRIFQLNAALHPKSANAFDSLGEAYMNSGDKALAIQFYEKSLALDPNNSNAVSKIKKLKEN